MNKKQLLALPLANLLALIATNDAVAMPVSEDKKADTNLSVGSGSLHPDTVIFMREMADAGVLSFSEGEQALVIETAEMPEEMIEALVSQTNKNVMVEDSTLLRLTDSFTKRVITSGDIRKVFPISVEGIEAMTSVENALRGHSISYTAARETDTPYEGGMREIRGIDYGDINDTDMPYE